MAFQGDAKNRRNILQGLQQTKSRLQRLQSGDPTSGRSSLYTASYQRGSPSPVSTQSTTARATRMAHSVSPSPSEYMVQQQQQKVILQQANAQSFSYFISQPSLHGNVIMPVLPRFDSNGQLEM